MCRRPLSYQKQRLKAVQGLGKARIWRLARFEFEPQREKFLTLIGRKQAKDPLGCCTFLLCQHGFVPACGVDWCVSGINLNNVVQEQQLGNVQGIHVLDMFR